MQMLAHAQMPAIDGNDTPRISKLIKEGKDYKLASDGTNLVKLAATLEQAGIASHSNVGQLYATLFQMHSNWLFSNYTEALKYALKALDQSQKWHINNRLPEIYGMIGTVYKENLDYPKALDAADKAIEAAKALNDTVSLISCYRNKAMFMHSYSTHFDNTRDTGKALLEQSIQMHLMGLALAKSNPKFEINSIGYYSNISQYYLGRKDYPKAISYAEQGVALATKYKQYKSLTYTYNWLGETYFAQGQRQKGITFIEKALDLCKEYHFIFREMELYSSLEECYAKSGDYENAWRANKRSIAISDSLKIIKNVQQLDEINVKYQTAQKNARIELLSQSEHQKNLLFVIAGAVILMLIAFVAILYRHKRSLDTYNASLISNNKTINDQALKLELLLKELHHRVKNNLQIVTSLLNLQANRLNDPEAVHAIRDSQQRIETMSLIHRTLYQQQNSSSVDMKTFIADLVNSVMNSYGLTCDEIDFRLDTNAVEMDIDIAMPLGLMINELVINSIKHAYYGKPKVLLLEISLLYIGDDCVLEVNDNGPGVAASVWLNPQSSFGIKLIKLLTIQLDGKSEMKGENGTHFKLEIKGNRS
jgi:two-component sensor histidine kinase